MIFSTILSLLSNYGKQSQVSGGGAPSNAYVAEDNTTNYVTEDNSTYYVQE